MLTVDIRGLRGEGEDYLLGSLTLKDGNAETHVADPSSHDAMASFAEEVNAEPDVENALRRLPLKYRSPYLRAHIRTK